MQRLGPEVAQIQAAVRKPVLAQEGADPVEKAERQPMNMPRRQEEFMARKIDNLIALQYPSDRLEIVVVSDGSSDGTAAILRQYAGNVNNGRRVISIEKASSQGKAAGLNEAMNAASGEILARLQSGLSTQNY